MSVDVGNLHATVNEVSLHCIAAALRELQVVSLVAFGRCIAVDSNGSSLVDAVQLSLGGVGKGGLVLSKLNGEVADVLRNDLLNDLLDYLINGLLDYLLNDLRYLDGLNLCEVVCAVAGLEVISDACGNLSDCIMSRWWSRLRCGEQGHCRVSS